MHSQVRRGRSTLYVHSYVQGGLRIRWTRSILSNRSHRVEQNLLMRGAQRRLAMSSSNLQISLFSCMYRVERDLQHSLFSGLQAGNHGRGWQSFRRSSSSTGQAIRNLCLYKFDSTTFLFNQILMLSYLFRSRGFCSTLYSVSQTKHRYMKRGFRFPK